VKWEHLSSLFCYALLLLQRHPVKQTNCVQRQQVNSKFTEEVCTGVTEFLCNNPNPTTSEPLFFFFTLPLK